MYVYSCSSWTPTLAALRKSRRRSSWRIMGFHCWPISCTCTRVHTVCWSVSWKCCSDDRSGSRKSECANNLTRSAPSPDERRLGGIEKMYQLYMFCFVYLFIKKNITVIKNNSIFYLYIYIQGLKLTFFTTCHSNFLPASFFFFVFLPHKGEKLEITQTLFFNL